MFPFPPFHHPFWGDALFLCTSNLPFSLGSDLSFLCNSISWDALGDVVRITGSTANEVVLNYLSFSKVKIGMVDELVCKILGQSFCCFGAFMILFFFLVVENYKFKCMCNHSVLSNKPAAKNYLFPAIYNYVAAKLQFWDS